MPDNISRPHRKSTSNKWTPFELLLRPLVNDRDAFTSLAGDLIVRLITFDGHLPLLHALDALTPFEQSLVTSLHNYNSVRLTKSPQRRSAQDQFRLFANSLGLVYLRPTHIGLPRLPTGVHIHQIGYLCIPSGLVRHAQAIADVTENEEHNLRQAVTDTLNDIELAGGIQQLLDAVAESVRHVEAVCFYVDDELFSVAERCNTLLDTKHKLGILSKLRAQPVATWSGAQRIAVIALRALFLTGRSIRFEEFNGKRISMRSLIARIGDIGISYGVDPVVKSVKQLLTFAEAVGTAGRTAPGRPWLRFRWINGLTYLKTERTTARPSERAVADAITPEIEYRYTSWLGKTLDPRVGYRTLFAELAQYALAHTSATIPAEGPAHSPLELLIQDIVASAVTATKSDYGMSSSLRDISPLQEVAPLRHLANVLELRPDHFFTCLVSRQGLREALGTRICEHVYRAVQARMQFNRWHFIAGNFPEPSVPKQRHYFYPPLIPDFAEWSDQLHGGHRKGGVRYSIRAPGPDLGEPPLTIGQHEYRGFYDVRVVRMSGAPYTLVDMLVVRHHCLWMGVIWQAIVRRAVTSPRLISITGFQNGDGHEITHRRSATSHVSAEILPAGRRRTVHNGKQLYQSGIITRDAIPDVDLVSQQFALSITPHLLDLIDPKDVSDPIARQFVPDRRELLVQPDELADPIGDDPFSPIKGVTHRYPDRLLLKPVHICPVYCRFCFRREKVSDPTEGLSDKELDAALDYIRQHLEVWEVILSGGDPLVMSARRLRHIVQALDSIAHVEVIRIHTRVPIAEPHRVTPSIVRALKVDTPVYVIIHSNHPRELTADVRRACATFVDSGIPLLSQTVLLKGINDNPATMAHLMRALVKTRVKPYYLHHGDLAQGTSHFRTSIAEGQSLIRSLRGALSGMCQPTYVLDIPDGYGKVPIGPQYISAEQGDGTYSITDIHGRIHCYPPRR